MIKMDIERLNKLNQDNVEQFNKNNKLEVVKEVISSVTGLLVVIGLCYFSFQYGYEKGLNKNLQTHIEVIASGNQSK
jgi:hypothetical protein